jgi:hypothetical protein
MHITVRVIASVVLGVLLLVPLEAIFDAAGWPVYHSYGLVHGTFATAAPALVLASFACLGIIPWFGPTVDTGPRLLASLMVFPLEIALFWVDKTTTYAFFSPWHAAVYGTTVCLLAVLCMMARKPVLVPLFLLVPIAFEPTFSVLSGSGSLELFAFDFVLKILPVVVTSGVAFGAARNIKTRNA